MSETFICSHCGYRYDVEEMNQFDGSVLCENCYNEETVVCEHCGTRLWEDNSVGSDIVLCEDCFQDYYVNCSDCGQTIHNDNANYLDDDDYPYCCNCYEQRCSQEIIHSYNFKPEPIFYGDGDRYFGVELEIDVGGQDDSNAEILADIANTADEKLIYIKRDGSLNDGMEIVTHPMSLDYHLDEMPWESVMHKAVKMGYRSHKTTTCGLHIHVNRTAFGANLEEQDESISRVLFFVERFWQELLKFSRRTEVQMTRWAARYGIKENPKATLDNAKKNRSGRYACVNLTNYHTIEFRIFRGTLKYSTLVATLQLVNKICDIAISMSDEEITALNWCDFVSGIEETELINYLKERRLYVNEPVECEEEV